MNLHPFLEPNCTKLLPSILSSFTPGLKSEVSKYTRKGILGSFAAETWPNSEVMYQVVSTRLSYTNFDSQI